VRSVSSGSSYRGGILDERYIYLRTKARAATIFEFATDRDGLSGRDGVLLPNVLPQDGQNDNRSEHVDVMEHVADLSHGDVVVTRR